MRFTSKQVEVFKCYLEENPKILITSGAKRAGKTFVMCYTFLHHINKYKNQGLSFILGGTTLSTLRRNVIDDLELILGKELRFDRSNAIEIFGNKVYCFHGANADSYKSVRGFTAAGAFLNEGTVLHDTFVKEVISRCSYDGARIFIDTNPENPIHPIKTDYIDQDGQRLSNGQLNIRAFHFSLYDNDTLNDEYIESTVANTPSGMFFDRDVLGLWVAAEGVVYQDFDQDKHYISMETINSLQFDKFFAGVDWGYKHYGSIVVVGRTVSDEYILIEEVATQYEEIDYWVDVAMDIKERYGNIMFYCDSARPEYVQRFMREGLMAVNANKEVIPGISNVASLMKQDRLYVNDNAKKFKEEINLYVWNENTGEPIGRNDDVLDALRYGIHSELSGRDRFETVSKGDIGL